MGTEPNQTVATLTWTKHVPNMAVLKIRKQLLHQFIWQQLDVYLLQFIHNQWGAVMRKYTWTRYFPNIVIFGDSENCTTMASLENQDLFLTCEPNHVCLSENTYLKSIKQNP